MAINIQNIIAALEAKVAAATSTTETQELIVIIKSIKAAGQQTVVTYADVPNLPTASADNAGNLAFVAAVGRIYYSNGTTWTEVGSGSGGGTAYDQSLNTTDDVVFNSALIGDVSIIANQISGVDAYGNETTLELKSPVEIKGIGTELSPAELSFNAPAVSVGMSGIRFYNLQNSQSAAQDLLNVPLNTVITTTQFMNFSNYQGISLRFSVSGFSFVNDMYDPSQISDVYVSPNNNEIEYSTNNGQTWIGTSIYATNIMGQPSFINLSYEAEVDVPKTVVSVTNSGVNVEGTFTVNGQPVSGGSGFDGGSLVATDALIGDVTIIGNEISGVDAYGNDATLALNIPVEFKTTETVGSQTTIQTGFMGIRPTLNFATYENIISFTNLGILDDSTKQKLINIPSNSLITTNEFYSFQTYDIRYFRFVALSTEALYQNPYNPSELTGIRCIPANGSLQFSTDGVNWSAGSFDQVEFNGNNGQGTITYGTISIVDKTVATVTESGLAVNDVTFDETLQFKTTIAEPSQANLQFGSTRISSDMMDGIRLYEFNGNSQSEAETLSNLPSGTVITTNNFYNYSGYAWLKIRFTVSSISVVRSFYNPTEITNIYIIPAGNEFEWSQNNGPWITSSTSTFQFNGLNQDSALTLSYDSTTNVIKTVTTISPEGVIADSALIGDVSIAGNTIAGVDSYGNADTLVVDGDLQIVGSLELANTNELPTDASSAVKYAKVVVGGQTYYMPLFQ